MTGAPVVHLLRHPPVAVDPGVATGRMELPLQPGWEAVVDGWRRALPPGLPVFSSPAARCRLPAARLHPAPVLDPRLLELDLGRWQGRRWDELPREETEPWLADWVRRAPPGGESFADLARRVGAFLEERAREGRDCVVVAHAGVVRAALCFLDGLPPERAFEIDVPFGAHRVRPLLLPGGGHEGPRPPGRTTGWDRAEAG